MKEGDKIREGKEREKREERQTVGDVEMFAMLERKTVPPRPRVRAVHKQTSLF